MGFSPDLAVGVYVGYDNPAPMDETGAKAALPVFREFMRAALKDKEKVPFRIPEGVLLAPVDATTGEASFIGAPNTILEAFKPGTEPKLGAISDTIRIGESSFGGVSNIGNSGYAGDFESYGDYEDPAGDSEATSEDVKPAAEAGGEDDLLSGGMQAAGAGEDKPKPEAEAETAEAIKPPAVKQPVRETPEPEPKEDILDDGLY